jgi:hypothetical protein
MSAEVGERLRAFHHRPAQLGAEPAVLVSRPRETPLQKRCDASNDQETEPAAKAEVRDACRKALRGIRATTRVRGRGRPHGRESGLIDLRATNSIRHD